MHCSSKGSTSSTLRDPICRERPPEATVTLSGAPSTVLPSAREQKTAPHPSPYLGGPLERLCGYNGLIIRPRSIRLCILLASTPLSQPSLLSLATPHHLTMRTPLLVVLTTLALFTGVVSSIDSGPRARAAGASPRPSPKMRPSVAWPARAASPKPKRAPQHWSPPSPRPPHPSQKPPQPSQKHPHDHKKRSEEDQSVLGGGGGAGGILGVIIDASHADQKDNEEQGWRGEERCPESLTACPVRGSLDTDAFECVDLLADLSSCGGCAADDIVCV